ncbi:MAG: extracellular solute-binding protein [Armatimonadota bacterium]|jgi:multiple sugar transport system permease protein
MGIPRAPLLLALLWALCAHSPLAARTKLVVWGLPSGEWTRGRDAAIAEFTRRHPGIEVVSLSMGAGSMNPQKLMTSIVGGVPPDLVHQDRFTIGDWASRDAFRALDDLIAADTGPDAIRAEDYYPACWEEAVYEGSVYAIPFNTDCRALYYNRDLFRRAGLDPGRPPRTWDELFDYAVKLTEYNEDGSFKTIGFIPNYGNSWLYLYSWQNGGEFMSPDGRTCTLANEATTGSLEFMVRCYDALKGADRIGAFTSTFQPNELDPFIVGKVAMKIDGNWVLDRMARFGPTVDFGVVAAPVPEERLEGAGRFAGRPTFITWSGGFSFAIPEGSKHVREAWLFIKWMNSLEGQRVMHEGQKQYNAGKGRLYVPSMSANQTVNEVIFREFAPTEPKYRDGLRTFLGLMPVSRYRPVTFVGQKLWDEHVRAFDMAIHHKAAPDEALLAGQESVQAELDKIFTREQYPPLHWRAVVATLSGLALVGVLAVVMLWRRHARVGRLQRSEVLAGYLFASPWAIGFLLFAVGPIVASLVFSFCSYDVLHQARSVGLGNYRELLGLHDLQVHWMSGLGDVEHWWHYLQPGRYFTITATANDPIIWKSIYNVLYLSIFGIGLGLVVSLSLALLLNTDVRGMSWYRTACYLPTITPVVAAALLWPWLLNPEIGLVNLIWRATLGAWLDIPAPAWLAGELTSKPSYVIVGLWGAGGAMILWLAGLQGIPQQLYEAAQIDGAGWWARFRHVTLPMLTPYIFFNLIMGTIGSLQRFTDVYIMSGPLGGPVDSTMVPVLYLFNNAFQYFRMGYASAWAWILFLIILTLALIQLKLAPRWVYYEGQRK